MVTVNYLHWGNDNCTRDSDLAIPLLVVLVSLSTADVVIRLKKIYTYLHFVLAFH